MTYLRLTGASAVGGLVGAAAWCAVMSLYVKAPAQRVTRLVMELLVEGSSAALAQCVALILVRGDKPPLTRMQVLFVMASTTVVTVALKVSAVGLDALTGKKM
jgi:hypothetical protein